jgi:hypothetical protein
VIFSAVWYTHVSVLGGCYFRYCVVQLRALTRWLSLSLLCGTITCMYYIFVIVFTVWYNNVFVLSSCDCLAVWYNHVSVLGSCDCLLCGTLMCLY